ncbi:myosin-6 [Eurytemora carolleeae]|uniref:myosin-6 n=1 Tax=Eurytemora carolleeae TaxID=1294199 RepID=UPI000C78B7ED|nr:myosin-6 [Eurytemora carolleeae]|eukprot:XP_023348458.1 myosin-6-like [Eurytemora affinis]
MNLHYYNEENALNRLNPATSINTAAAEEIRGDLEDACSSARELHSSTRKQLTELGQLLPQGTQEKLSKTELAAEQLLQQLEELEGQHKRARTVRYEFQVDVEEVQFWISRSESKIQDRNLQPHLLKDNLNQIQGEVGGITEQLDNLTTNGKIIIANTNNQPEKELVQSTISNLSDQLTQLKQLIEEKKNAANDAIDAWQKFLSMEAMVRGWIEEKKTFLTEPLTFTSLSSAKLKLQDYNATIKSIKNVNKNVEEMTRELGKITSVGSAGDLQEKLSDTEKDKSEIESGLQERNALLLELTEEWDQCERKLKDTRVWAGKARDSLESLQNKKRPLRDQLNLREKMVNDITIQRRRAMMSLEKLQIHFTEEMEGDQDIHVLGREIDSDLEKLNQEIKDQTQVLESCLSQLDQYHQEIGVLRQKILSCEGELRTVSSPAYLAKDRDRAVAEQSACRERIKGFQSKITAFTQRMNLINQRGTPDQDSITS